MANNYEIKVKSQSSSRNISLKGQSTAPGTFEKELQLVAYRGTPLFSDEGNSLTSVKRVPDPRDFLASSSTPVVVDSESYAKTGVSLENKFGQRDPAALPIEEVFNEVTEVSSTLLGIPRGETQQGIFDNVSSYGLDRKDWIIYAGYPDYRQGGYWERKNSPAGRHQPTVNFDDAEGSSVVISSYPVPYTTPGNPIIASLIRGEDTSDIGPGWGRYLQSLIAMYVIEYMVNNFTEEEKVKFRLEYLESTYPKTTSGKFNRLYWDQIWLDIDQGRFKTIRNLPIIPRGRIENMTGEGEAILLDLFSLIDETKDTPYVTATNTADNGGFNLLRSKQILTTDSKQSILYTSGFFGTTRYRWPSNDKGHFEIATQPNKEVWREYWLLDYDSLYDDLKNWEFKVWETDPPEDSPEKKYKLPYYRIFDKETPSESLIFGQSWPKTYSDPTIPQVSNALAEGNLIGSRESDYAVVTMTSARAFRYQPGRISGFTYGVRVSEEGAGPGSILEFGVENYTDGYFFRLKDGTDFSIVRRSTIPLGETDLFIDAGYEEREAYISQLTGVIKYRDELTDSEVLRLERLVEDKKEVKVYETEIQQDLMNGDGLNSQGETGYIYNPDTVTMYKIEFGWYGAIGARFYIYIPTKNGDARWVTLHTLVIENNIDKPCLEDPFFFFKYRTYVGSPSRIRLPQFIEKYGASYYIDGGDEGTVTVSSAIASNRDIESTDLETDTGETIEQEIPIYRWASVLGLKPKKFITNTQGNEFFNKKEIFPISASMISTVDTEIKFVNQFGCVDHGFTFQEGYKCELPESQRLRGKFLINRLETDEDTLIELGYTEDRPTPTISYQGPDPDFPEASLNLLDIDGTGYTTDYLGNVDWETYYTFKGWDSYQYALQGSHIIGNNVFCAYVNPENEYINSSTGWSNSISTAAISRVVRGSTYDGRGNARPWSKGQLLFRYPDVYSLKFSPYRKDTTLISSVGITSGEFYLLFTTKAGGRDDNGVPCSDEYFGSKCDGDTHFGDITIGVMWSRGSEDTYANQQYPIRMVSKDRAQNHPNSFGIVNPAIDGSNIPTGPNVDIEFVSSTVSDTGTAYIKDKRIPNSDEFRYYEGLPVDVFSPALRDNTLMISQAGWLHTGAGGIEKSEGGRDSPGEIDEQFPNVPGAEGGECHALFCRVGPIEREISIQNEDGSGNTNKYDDNETEKDVYYLRSNTSWPSELWVDSQGNPKIESLTLKSVSTNVISKVKTIGEAQDVFKREGSSIEEYLLPVVVETGFSLAGLGGGLIISEYAGIALYAPSLIKKDDRLITSTVSGSDVFPIRWFIAMREGAEIGSLSIGQEVGNGIIQSPFSPLGQTLSIDHYTNDGQHDRHDGGSSDIQKSAIKNIRTFSEADTLDTSVNFSDTSYIDNSDPSDPGVKRKKCPSFLSRNLLVGASYSSVGDYPIRSLKFKDTGDDLGSFYLSKNTPTDVDLTSMFNISAESIGPSFWNNKSLFVIAKSLEDETEGKISITLNYKEQ